MSDQTTSSEHGREEAEGWDLAKLSLAAIGVVFGDIGTSPIYAIRESFHEGYGLEVTAANVMGILSLIFWSLIIVISIKYLALVLQADNEGEGGIIALAALVSPPGERMEGRRWVLLLLGLFGAALLYGDSVITPAISVVSAIEGLQVATPVFEPYVVPIALGILVGLFLFQRRGTAGVGAIFGPVTLTWFLVLAVLGVSQLVQHPEVLRAVHPGHAADFFARNAGRGFLVLGSVFLVVTGGEALYADMGHFGTRPIRLTWFFVVLPALLLNYFGQGALLVAEPEAVSHPFYHMAPEWALYPMVVIATAATIIASQAVISGAFSLTRQAVQLGFFPRMEWQHTSETRMGQIYMPAINWTLMFGCIGLVIGFQTSSNLASAYGVAVTTDMVFTTLLFAVVARIRWNWSLWTVGGLAAALLVVDLAFWGANLPKIPDGGWFPLVVAGLLFAVMTTWKRGRQILGDRLKGKIMPEDRFLNWLEEAEPHRLSGTGVFMDSNPRGTPHALQHNIEYNGVLHERVLLLTVITREVPEVDPEERTEVREVGGGVYRVLADYGFAEDPDVVDLLETMEIGGEGFEIEDTTFYLGRETLIATEKPGMAEWREKLFARMSRNAQRATEYFGIPTERVVELGVQVEL